MGNNNLEDAINELKDLNRSSRSGFYTIVTICSDYYSLDFKLLYVNKINIVDGWLVLLFMDNVFKFKIIDSLRLKYNHNEPPLEDNRNKRSRIKR